MAREGLPCGFRVTRKGDIAGDQGATRSFGIESLSLLEFAESAEPYWRPVICLGSDEVGGSDKFKRRVGNVLTRDLLREGSYTTRCINPSRAKKKRKGGYSSRLL